MNTIIFPNEDVKDCLKTLQSQYSAILSTNLVGMYVHGSIAMNCFNPKSSDIDVLVVVKDQLPVETKQKLGQLHIQLSDRYCKTLN